MRILIFESYYGGSHKAFLDGLIRHSRHEFKLLALPARKWKWRMRGSAIWFADQLIANQGEPFDVIFTSDMVSVSDLQSLLPASLRSLPIVCYFHENQLTYPLTDEADRDYQYGFTNITSCLAADRVWFNSQYHLDSFSHAVESLLSRMPDYVPERVRQRIREKATVLHPGIIWIGPGAAPRRLPLTILWNHRWEYDKNPEEFFEVLFHLAGQRVAFRLIVVGEQFRTYPPVFGRAEAVLADRIDHWGYVPDQAEYRGLVQSADIVVSTATHEFFGLSVLEAVSAGCFAVLPQRLSYPELLGGHPAAATFYRNREELLEILRELLVGQGPPEKTAVADESRQFAWPSLINGFDEAFEKMTRM